MDPRGLLILVLIASLAHLGPEPGAWQVTAAAERRVEHVCQSLDIRNHVQAFYSLTNCTVIEGHLRILLIDYAEASDYEDLTFPDLREITGFLLLYRVYGLRTLSHIFPNLSVIRGQQLFYNYGLVVFEMPNFEELGLHSLTRIVRGAVRLEKNPDLCYVDTINWMKITSVNNEDNFIMQNKDVDECVNVCPNPATTNGEFPVMEVPMANGLKRSQPLCWNSQHWQKLCPRECGSRACYTVNSDIQCCHTHCLGGCCGPDATDCDACVNVLYRGRCLKKCPPGTYELMGRRCILEEECRNMTQGFSQVQNDWKLLNNKCVLGCPSGYMPSKKDEHKCEKCAGKCPKICDGMVIDNVAAAQKLKGCVVINGILEIQIRGGSHVGRELEENLGMIEEVTNYVKIVRSYAIISLRFLMSLRVIHGNQLYNDRYALFVLDNQNLQEVWDVNKHPNLTIEDGKVFFHFNRKLCLNKIEEFIHSVGLENVTEEKDVSRTSNGDQVACEISTLKLEVIHVMSNFAYIRWNNAGINDQRELLSWVVNYREAPEQNVTLFNARDACGSDVWKTVDVRPEIHKNARFVATLLILKPYTQYALYVQTYTIATANTGAMSPITYLKTKPDIPTPAHDIRVDARLPGELHVTWKEPSKTNGNVTHYYIYWQPQAIHPAKFDQRDYCKDRLRLRDRKQEETTKADTLPPPSYNEQCCECPKSKKEKRVEEEERQFQIMFENFLHNTVYIKRDPYKDVLSVLSQSANETDGPVQKSNKRRSKPKVAKTNGTLEDLKRQLGNQKKPRILWDLLPYNNSYSNLLDDYALNMNMTHMNESDADDDSDERPPYEAAVVYGKTEVILPNLHHFQEYSIEVIACHEYQEGMDEKLCSNRAVMTARTLPDKTADNIDQRNITVTNDTKEHQVWIRWLNPTSPNGLIVTYEIELTNVDESHYKPAIYCIKHLMYHQIGGYRTESVNPGNWSFRIRATSLAGNGSWTDLRYFYVPPIERSMPPNVQLIIGITVGVFLFMVILIAVIVIIIIKQSRFTPPSDAVISSNPDYWSEVYQPDEWEVARENIKLLTELGQGSFGMVYEGTARNIKEQASVIRVAIKTVNDNATPNDRIQFLKEASVMKAFNCSHVVKLLGVVSKAQPTLVIMELMSNGDLKHFLQMHRPDSEDNDGRAPLQVSQILQWAGDIADGMAYLSFRKFVHCDLAARNCMVSENAVIKIGDFGMTKDIYETDYYRKGGKGLLPVRWMAPESLRDGKFDSCSDVWSYGVVMWEMVTLAEQPYQGLSNEEVLHFVIGSRVMDTPERCPEKIEKLMAMCWKFRPNSRPSFGQILEILEPDLSTSFRDVSYYFNEANQKHATSDADDDTLTDDAKTPLTGTPHYVSTPMASSLQHHSSSVRGGSAGSHLLADELDYQDENNVSDSSGGSSVLGRSQSPLTCLHSSPCECVPLKSFGGAARTSRPPGGTYWNAQVEPRWFGQRSDSNSAIHSNGGTAENHISGSDSLGDGSGRPRNGLANGHIPMSYYPSGANRV